MFKKIFAVLAVIVLISAVTVPAAAFEPNNDPALARYHGFEGDIGEATTLFKDEPVRTPHLNTAGGNINYSAGVYGQGFNFDGVTGLYLGNDVVTGDNFTIAMWFNADEIQPWTSVFHARFLDGDDESGEDEVWMCIRPRTDLDANPERNMMFWTVGGGFYDYWFDGVSSVNIQPERWYHVAVTMAGEDIVFYVDGEISFDTKTADFNFTSNIENVAEAMRDLKNKRFYLGLNEMQDWPFKGTVDEFYAFNRALSQDEVKTLMSYDSTAAVSAEVSAPESASPVAPAAPTAPAAPAPAPTSASAPETSDDFALVIFALFAAAALTVVIKKAKAM